MYKDDTVGSKLQCLLVPEYTLTLRQPGRLDDTVRAHSCPSP
jgi:hypothetical protein